MALKPFEFLIPRDTLFLALLTEQAQNLAAVCDEVRIVLGRKGLDYKTGTVQDPLLTAELTVNDRNLYNKILHALTRTFITPFDREDIHDLSVNMSGTCRCLSTLQALSRAAGNTAPPPVPFLEALSVMGTLASGHKDILKALTDSNLDSGAFENSETAADELSSLVLKVKIEALEQNGPSAPSLLQMISSLDNAAEHMRQFSILARRILLRAV